ncbi:F-box/LRR-repeat protein 21-like [Ostrea edulis]|uniref:F-box/LRR-repeat protein 21-like n=1 Tax=Ostrea edulis TaxID=37623 RepID=UPI0024AF9A88|nr:F-box/LRR-repeat protein 21-like [Ostrea edulis]
MMTDSSSDQDGRDFSYLPTIAWVNILDHLNLNDKYRVSTTCSKLNEAFNHPTLWRKMTLFIMGNMENYGLHSQVMIPAQNIKLVKRFGKYFQNLTFVISGHLNEDFGDWNDLVEEVTKQCRLETLTLYVGIVTSMRHFSGYRSCGRNLIPLVNFVKNAFRLKNLNIISWPMFPRNLQNHDENIFEAAMVNIKLKDLENLSLFWSNTNSWTERQPILLSPNETVVLVNHFSNLKHLALRSPMMDENMLNVLSQRQRSTLQRLRILVNYISNDPDFEIPEISDMAWENFCLKNVGVQVELTIMSRVSLVELSNLLKPACPVYVTKFMAYSRCDGNVVQYLTDKYKKTLTCFESFGEDSCFEKELVNMVEKSPNLLKLVYRGNINCQNVECLAALRSRSWVTFDILRENIYVEENNIENRYDENEVIAKGPDGTYVLVAMLKFHQKEQSRLCKEAREDEMIDNVSSHLGRKWFPTSRKSTKLDTPLIV